MLLKIYNAIICGLLAVHLSGCMLMMAGAAGGAGTAAWLSNKLVKEVNASFDQSVQAAKSAFGKLQLKFVKETRQKNVTQLISEYYDGKKIWVDIHRLTPQLSRIEVRVGGIKGDEEAARKILNAILASL